MNSCLKMHKSHQKEHWLAMDQKGDLRPGNAEPQFGRVSVLIPFVSTIAELGFGDPGKNRNDNAACGLGVNLPRLPLRFIRVHLRSSVVPLFLSLFGY